MNNPEKLEDLPKELLAEAIINASEDTRQEIADNIRLLL